MTDKTALKTAVKALKYYADGLHDDGSVAKMALAALDATPQAAPSLPLSDEQIWDCYQHVRHSLLEQGMSEKELIIAVLRASKPASTAAQEAPQLTDEQIRRLAHEHLKGTGDHCILNFARALHQRSRTKCCH